MSALQVALAGIDKPMHQSKKYTALLLFSMTWKVLLAYSIYTGMSDAVLLAMIGASTTVESLGNGAQAWHDKHANDAKVTALKGMTSE